MVVAVEEDSGVMEVIHSRGWPVVVRVVVVVVFAVVVE